MYKFIVSNSRKLFTIYSIAVFYILLKEFRSTGVGFFDFIPNFDKIVHIFIFIFWTLLFIFAFIRNFKFKQIAALSLVAMFLLAYFTEFLQKTFTLTRHFDAMDIFADITGCVISLFIYFILDTFRFK